MSSMIAWYVIPNPFDGDEANIWNVCQCEMQFLTDRNPDANLDCSCDIARKVHVKIQWCHCTYITNDLLRYWGDTEY